MTPEQLIELADDLHVAPHEVAAAIALVRTAHVDLLAAVMSGRMTVREALAAAQKPALGPRARCLHHRGKLERNRRRNAIHRVARNQHRDHQAARKVRHGAN
jgi:hypothetical protein